MNILGTGLSGLVGSRVVELLSNLHTFDNLSKETGVDITDFQRIEDIVAKHSSDWIFHFAAYTDVQGAEKERALGENSQAWKINVEATKHLVLCCKQTGKRLLYLSTDYVFDGMKLSYTEEDNGNPQGWYAITKYEGEKAVKSLEDHGLVIRIANPYRANPVGKKDFMHKMRDRLAQGLPIQAPIDQIMTATYIDDLAHAIEKLIHIKATGVYNVPGEDNFSPYEAAKQIASVFGYDSSQIGQTTFAQYFEGKASIPKKAALTHDKIEALGISLHTFSEGCMEIKKNEGIKEDGI